MVGGLVGQTRDGSSFISNSFFSGNVSALDNEETSWVGISGTGGLVGLMRCIGSISDSFVAGNVIGEQHVGGLVGYVGSSYYLEDAGSISNSFITGNVTGEEYVGGLVGYLERGFISNSMALNEFVNGTAQVHSDFGYIDNQYDNEVSDLFVWENISMNGEIGTITNISRASVVTEVSSKDVWGSYPTSPFQTVNVWSAFGAADWTLNSYGTFRLPVHTWSEDPLLEYANVAADAAYLSFGFTVTYDGSGHTAGTVPEGEFYEWIGKLQDAAIKGPADLEKTGHAFTGWTEVGVAELWQPGEKRAMDSNVVLSAAWEPIDTPPGSGGGSGTGNATVRPPSDNNTTQPPSPPGDERDETPDLPYSTDPPRILTVLLFPFAIAIWAFVRKEQDHTEHKK
ncbi:MAG: InlB B-repeat-containing protein [Methanosarcinales archaeon]|nr:InlB B-repeat-containing protein [Methanosarcinales archaeon]